MTPKLGIRQGVKCSSAHCGRNSEVREPFAKLFRRFPGERENEGALGVGGAFEYPSRNPACQDQRLARPGAGDHAERGGSRSHCFELRGRQSKKHSFERGVHDGTVPRWCDTAVDHLRSGSRGFRPSRVGGRGVLGNTRVYKFAKLKTRIGGRAAHGH